MSNTEAITGWARVSNNRGISSGAGEIEDEHLAAVGQRTGREHRLHVLAEQDGRSVAGLRAVGPVRARVQDDEAVLGPVEAEVESLGGEAAALLVLRKKLDTFYGVSDEED